MVNFSTTILLATVAVCSAGNLEIEDLTDGAGNCRRPSRKGDTLKMHYTGTLASNGKQFDSSIGRGPFEFELGAGRVIKGWDQGLSGMCQGDKRKLTIPPELGYGSRGAGGDIPGGATLIFEVQLVGIDHGEQYTDERHEAQPEDKSTPSDNERNSGETSSDESQEEGNSSSAGKHLLQISLFLISFAVYNFI